MDNNTTSPNGTEPSNTSTDTNTATTPNTTTQDTSGTFLSKESAEALHNDMPTTTTDYSSIYQSVYNAPSGAQQPSEANTGVASAPIKTSEPTHATPGQPTLHQPVAAPPPVVTPVTEAQNKPVEKIVYKEKSRGCGCIGDLIWKLISFLGCLLFILSITIIGLAIWINF